MDVTRLIDTYCAAWNEADAARRAALLAEVWARGATYTDPTVHATGADELSAHIGGVQRARPGARIVRTSAVDAHHGVARFAWRLVQADGTALPEGLDFAVLNPEQTAIERIVGFFGPLRPAPAHDLTAPRP